MTTVQKLDIFDPALPPERLVTREEMLVIFGVDKTGLRRAIRAGRLPSEAERNWIGKASIWYVGQLREFFRGKCQDAIRRDRAAAKSAPPTSCATPTTPPRSC